MEQATLVSQTTSTETARLSPGARAQRSDLEARLQRWQADPDRIARGRRDWRQVPVQIAKAKKRFGLEDEVLVASCYEAGRDGFWIHRYLTHLGIDNVIVEPASIRVNRRARRAKTDRLDVRDLLGLLVRHAAGEPGVWSVVRVPSEEAEDGRRPHRECERLTKERTQHRSRLQSLLVLEGIRLKPGRHFLAALEQVRRWDGRPLPEHLRAELVREYQRLQGVEEQLAALTRETRARVARADTSAARKVSTLASLRGIGLRGATVLVGEFFGWRHFNNRREVGGLAGLDGTPYNSGASERDQGISKAGNRRMPEQSPGRLRGGRHDRWGAPLAGFSGPFGRMQHWVSDQSVGTDGRWSGHPPTLRRSRPTVSPESGPKGLDIEGVAAGQEGRSWCRASAPGGREEVKRVVAGWRGGIGEGRKGCRAPGTAVRHPGRAGTGRGTRPASSRREASEQDERARTVTSTARRVTRRGARGARGGRGRRLAPCARGWRRRRRSP